MEDFVRFCTWFEFEGKLKVFPFNKLKVGLKNCIKSSNFVHILHTIMYKNESLLCMRVTINIEHYSSETL